jgi:hypothetical protein
VIPKYHGAKLTDIPDDQLGEILVRLLIHIQSMFLPGVGERRGKRADLLENIAGSEEISESNWSRELQCLAE